MFYKVLEHVLLSRLCTVKFLNNMINFDVITVIYGGEDSKQYYRQKGLTNSAQYKRGFVQPTSKFEKSRLIKINVVRSYHTGIFTFA